MKEVLIIRSASVQQLDLNLPSVKNRFYGYQLSVLTHEHSVKAVEKYTDVGRVYIYHYKSGFRFWQKPSDLDLCRFDALIVQTANTSGNGYLNVLLFALAIRPKKIYICNPASEITEIKKSVILLRSILIFAFKLVSIVFLLPATIALFLTAAVGVCQNRIEMSGKRPHDK